LQNFELVDKFILLFSFETNLRTYILNLYFDFISKIDTFLALLTHIGFILEVFISSPELTEFIYELIKASKEYSPA